MARYRSYDDYGYGGWPPYVPVAERRRRALAKIAGLKKKGREVSPINIKGRTIAITFWGKAWCENLESYSDFSNRLPRGRTYVRNGSVIDLQIAEGKVTALVQGSSLYKVEIAIRPMEAAKWRAIVAECSRKIESLVELIQGRLSTSVMSTITNQKSGLFPTPKQIALKCSCPDWAEMCKHVAATLYGVGARLDEKPELLFRLRKTNHLDLIAGAKVPQTGAGSAKAKVIEESSLSDVFGIELDAREIPAKAAPKKSSIGRRKMVANRRMSRPEK